MKDWNIASACLYITCSAENVPKIVWMKNFRNYKKCNPIFKL